MLGCTLFPQFTQRLKTEILNVALGCSNISHDERDKKTGVFLIWPCLVRDSLVDQSMLFTHLYIMQGEEIEAWFVSPASREYLVLNPQFFSLRTNSQ